jgi:hypothetical protein
MSAIRSLPLRTVLNGRMGTVLQVSNKECNERKRS